MTISEENIIRIKRAQAAKSMTPYVDGRMPLEQERRVEGRPVPTNSDAPVYRPSGPDRGPRDTDADWQAIASTHPYFGVLANEQFRNPDAAALREFFESGERDIEAIEAALRRAFGRHTPRSALDFGCGVGRLLIPMARRAGRAYGVDVAQGMLDLAQKHATEAGVSVQLSREIPVEQRFDWVNSMIVVQHIPPVRGYNIIRSLWNCVAPGGALTIHVTIYKIAGATGEVQRDIRTFAYDGERVLNYTADQAEGVGMSMYDYDLSRVFACMDLGDGVPVYMEKVDHGGCHGFRIYVRKQ